MFAEPAAALPPSASLPPQPAASRRVRRVIALIAVLFLGHIVFTAHFFDRWDEIEYIQLGQGIAQGRFPSSPKRLPLFPCAIAAVHLAVPDWSLAARVTARLTGAALIGAVGGLAAEVFGLPVAALAALLVASAPLLFVAASIVHPITLLALLTTLAAWALVRHATTRSAAALALATLFVALAGFTRPEGFALAPLAAWWTLRALRRREVGGRNGVALAGSWIAILLSAAWFATHCWYGRAVADEMAAAGALPHFFSFLFGYLRLLPWELSIPTALLAAAGIVRTVARARRGALDERVRAFALVSGWLVAAELIGLSAYLAFTSLYTLPVVPFVVAFAAFGLDGLARRAASRGAGLRRAVVGGALALALAANLATALYSLRQYQQLIADYHDACLWVRDHRDPGPNGRPGGVVAMSPAHLDWWTGIPSVPYSREVAGAARFVILSDLFAPFFGFDYDLELRHLVDDLGGRIVCAPMHEVRPILCIAYCQPLADVMTPRAVDSRFKLHRFRSAVVELPPRRRGPR